MMYLPTSAYDGKPSRPAVETPGFVSAMALREHPCRATMSISTACGRASQKPEAEEAVRLLIIPLFPVLATYYIKLIVAD
jgi:hypothetical protein